MPLSECSEPAVSHPISDYDAVTVRLQKSPHDPESWKSLVDLAETSKEPLRIRHTYDALLKQYPNTAAAQLAYVDHLLQKNDYSDAEELLNKYLRTSTSVELWIYYLRYVRQANTGTGPESHETIRNAFNFALDHIGQDRDSGSIWAEYISFLNSTKASSTWDNEQKVDALRKAYHKAIQIPLDNIEDLWRNYGVFETGLDKTAAMNFRQDLTPAYMRARTVLRQLSVHLQGLGTTGDQSKLFIPALPTFSPQERPLIGRWKAYLKWEESNPLEIEEKRTLNSRIQMAYRKAIVRMRYYPEIWFMAYSWNALIGQDEALNILKAGLEANPDSFVLTYAYAELLERAELKKDHRDYAEVHAVYMRFFRVLRAHLTHLTDAAAASESPVEEPIRLDATGTNGISNANANTTEAAPAPAPVTRNHAELIERKQQYSNTWINYMRFARRAQGQHACRDAFRKARSDEYIGWEVYEAAAMSEYRCNLNDGWMVASRIFEIGMKKFATNVAFVLSHLSFLLTVNDEDKARALFEGVIGKFTPQEAKPIWEHWSRSQYQYDDLEAVLELERRMAKVYPNGVFLFSR
ncbi:hypothetical protein DFH07DRAFT_762011 [Mycena maculata]|uniref:mRNA 3'-end-processing protein RNA14 n=1 Tax=Mycena maculata TaxID=230809 RepID=A0AAD7HCB0_9AGAR|nr:hypothetical protein DFH07DRAFT_762011 [Mycena maculata]